MKASEPDGQQQAETVEHLLGIVVENREKRCTEVRNNAWQQAREIIRQAHTKSRARMHRHINALRDKQRQRVSSAIARNQTLLRQQHQKADRAIIDMAWPMLREAMQALWNVTASRQNWLDAVMASAADRLLQPDIRIEHSLNMSEQELSRIKQQWFKSNGNEPDLLGCEDIDAGIRIIAQGTVIDATLDGLLKQRTSIEALLMARVKQGGAASE